MSGLRGQRIQLRDGRKGIITSDDTCSGRAYVILTGETRERYISTAAYTILPPIVAPEVGARVQFIGALTGYGRGEIVAIVQHTPHYIVAVRAERVKYPVDCTPDDYIVIDPETVIEPHKPSRK